MKLSNIFFYALIGILLIPSTHKAATFTWNGSTSQWDLASNWTLTSGTSSTNYPVNGDDVTINSGAPIPELGGDVTLNNFTISNGKMLDLKGFNLSITGVPQFFSGAIITSVVSSPIASVLINSATTATTNLSSTGNTMEFGSSTNLVNVKIISGRIVVAGGLTVYGDFEIEKTGTGYDIWTTGNNYQGLFKLTLASSATNGFYLGYSGSATDNHYGDLEIVNDCAGGVVHFSSGALSNALITGDVKILNKKTGTISIANNITGASNNNANVIINGDLEFENQSTGSIVVASNSAAGTVEITLTQGTITTMGASPSTGVIVVKKVTHEGTGANSLEMASVGSNLTIENNSLYGGEFAAASISVRGNTFEGPVSINKEGAGTNMEGDNHYKGTVHYINNSGITWYVGYNNNKENQIHDKDVTYTCNSGSIYASYYYTSYYNNNIVVNSGGGDIVFGGNGVARLAEGKTITALNFSTGNLELKNFEQMGSTTQNITLTGTATLKIIVGTVFNGEVNIVAPNVFVNGGLFKNTVNIEKTGDGDNESLGGAVFEGVTTIKHSGTGSIRLAKTNPDTYNDLHLVSNGTNYIYVALGAAGTIFNGDVYLHKTAGNYGFIFGNGVTASCSLAVGKKIIADNESFTTGVLWIKRLVQLGITTPQELDIPAVQLILEKCKFEAEVSIKSRNLNLQENQFMSVSTFESCNPASGNDSHGGNMFESIVYLINSGGSNWVHGTQFPEIYNDDLILINKSTGNINLARYTDGTTFFHGNIIVENHGAGIIIIGQATTNTTTSILAEGKTIIVGEDGFNGGALVINRILQVGNTPISLNFDEQGTGTINFSNYNVINGPLTLTAPNVAFTGDGSVYNGSVDVAITSLNVPLSQHTQPNWVGSSTFNEDVTVTITAPLPATNYFHIAKNASDLFKFYGNVTFNRNTNVTFYAAYRGTVEFYKNVTYNNPFNSHLIEFGYGGAVCKFLGSEPQSINADGSHLKFYHIVVDKPSNDLILNIPVYIIQSIYPSPVAPFLTLTKGKIIANAPHYLKLGDNGTVIGGSQQSFLEGVFKKVGNDAFSFPVGDVTYRPIAISAPINTATEITVEYFEEGQSLGADLESLLKDISNCEYWSVSSNAAYSINYTLNWSNSSCHPINKDVVTVARFNGTSWEDEGGIVNGTDESGSVTSNTINQYGYFTFGYKTKLILNTTEVNTSEFNILSGSEPISTTLTSGSGGSNSGSSTLAGSQNLISGVYVLHPDLASPGTSIPVDITIQDGGQNKSLNVRLHINDQSEISKVEAELEGVYKEMSEDYYSLTENTIFFHKQKPDTESPYSISTNLNNGILFDHSTISLFEVEVPGFSNVVLDIYDKNNTKVYSISGNQWDGKANLPSSSSEYVAPGVYKFEVTINGSNIYQGQFIFQ